VAAGWRRAEVEVLPPGRVWGGRGHAVLAACCRSGVPIREPAQRSQARGEAVLAATGDDERRHAGETPPDRPPRDRERPRAVVRPGDRILLGRGADEDPVVEP